MRTTAALEGTYYHVDEWMGLRESLKKYSAIYCLSCMPVRGHELIFRPDYRPGMFYYLLLIDL